MATFYQFLQFGLSMTTPTPSLASQILSVPQQSDRCCGTERAWLKRLVLWNSLARETSCGTERAWLARLVELTRGGEIAKGVKSSI